MIDLLGYFQAIYLAGAITAFYAYVDYQFLQNRGEK